MLPMLYAIAAVLVFISFIIYIKSGSFIKSMLTSVIGGVTSLCAVGALSFFIPLSLGINWYSLVFSALFSVPGVIFLLLSKTFLF